MVDAASREGDARVRFETLLAEISSRFVHRNAADVDPEIEDAQRRICECLGLDMATLWQWSPGAADALSLTHVYRPPGGPPVPVPMNAADHFPWITRQILAGVIVRVSSLQDMPDDAATDRQNAQHFGIRSFVAFPLSAGDEPSFGALTFDAMREERTWSDETVQHLQLVAEVFANALARKRADEAVRSTEARLQAGADLAGLGFYEMDYARGDTYLDDRLRDICGVPPEREPGLGTAQFWMEHLHPDDRARVLEARQALHDGRVGRLSMEYRFLHPRRGQIWIQHVGCIAVRDAAGRAIRSYGVLADVTERKRAEEALLQSYAEIKRLKERLEAERDYLKAEIRVTLSHGEVTGESAAIKQVLRLVEQVAPTDSSVLVCGETGTGKELIAQSIHRLSTRRDHLMVKVNCAALPSGLIESELFGREKGAYTGALMRQVGRFEVADHSTLFLDEIGELSLEVQAKLLRVLEKGEFERLGSPRTVKVKVRLIAATNRDLEQDIRAGRFREDLYYRLNVFPIRVPPLRERADDIPLLVWSFLEEFGSRMGKKITQVPRATMEAFQRQPWPGNVRQLRNVIEHAVIVTTGDTLRVEGLGDVVPGAAQPRTLADAERDHIRRVLEATGGRIKGPKGAAAVLGLNASTLRSRMQKLGIEAHRHADDA